MAAVVALGRLRASTPAAQWPQLVCMQLGFALPFAAAVAGMLHYGVAPGWSAPHSWLSSTSSYIGLPLPGLAALNPGYKWLWSGKTWCYLLISLYAFFELFRRFGWLDEYRPGLQLASLLLIVQAGLLQWPLQLPPLLAAAVAGLFVCAGLVIGTDGVSGPLRRIDLFHALLTLAYPLLAWRLIRLTTGESPAKGL